MLILKFLFTFILFYYLWKLLFWLVVRAQRSDEEKAPRPRGAPGRASRSPQRETVKLGEMCPCEACGVYIVKDRAILIRERYYCSLVCSEKHEEKEKT